MTKKNIVVTIMVKHFDWKTINLTELKKSKSDNFVAVEESKTYDNPSEYNFLICDILNL